MLESLEATRRTSFWKSFEWCPTQLECLIDLIISWKFEGYKCCCAICQSYLCSWLQSSFGPRLSGQFCGAFERVLSGNQQWQATIICDKFHWMHCKQKCSDGRSQHLKVIKPFCTSTHLSPPVFYVTYFKMYIHRINMENISQSNLRLWL